MGTWQKRAECELHAVQPHCNRYLFRYRRYPRNPQHSFFLTFTFSPFGGRPRAELGALNSVCAEPRGASAPGSVTGTCTQTPIARQDPCMRSGVGAAASHRICTAKSFRAARRGCGRRGIKATRYPCDNDIPSRIFSPHSLSHLFTNMFAHSQDDCFLSRHNQFNENIDYMSPVEISNFHLHLCWKENNSVSVKNSQEDICTQIPSTISRRLENIAWRRLYKQIYNLGEALPSIINWNKNQDVTWLYGPKYNRSCAFDDSRLTKMNLLKLSCDEWADFSDEISLVSSTRLMSFDDRSLVELCDDDEEMEYTDLKLALKSERRPFKRQDKQKKKRVTFNYIINSREFMNGHSIDYHFLDTLCL